ncbi:squalene--hopene cyclase [Priestia koreensis]|uniref:squalene--hopene cyclase n=1 Tax=Priestia koreensis TaxID=284581 RepID=UPI001F5A18D4|nr:squalene--hopene cyclase [Priestia koreensis]MCM3005324.1 squalene--hopene cyclase [Priestia koreensis]UNL86538.1 squalene--hopene cyclase [Priestia koreensis]
MISTTTVQQNIQKRIAELRKWQQPDGRWRFCFEGSIMTNAFVIILLRTLQVKEEKVIKQLATYIRNRQHPNGYWNTAPDEKGHLTSTVLAYTALLCAGDEQESDEHMKKAKKFIEQNGGIAKAHFMTKWMLAVNGLYKWPSFFYIPMSFLLIPSYAPVNFFDLSAYARIHFVPMMIAANKKFSLSSPHMPSSFFRTYEEDDWLVGEDRSFVQLLVNEMKKIAALPTYIHEKGYKEAENYMLQRIERDGTLYSYVSSTVFMIYALLALGYDKRTPVIRHALKGILEHAKLLQEDELYIENSTSTVWDTSLLTYALQEAGVEYHDPMITAANHYLVRRQHDAYGDWSVHNPRISPGGWGFSDSNTLNPDLDDTSAVLRALTRTSSKGSFLLNWTKGNAWLLSMQNRDGGFAAFEKNTDSSVLTHLPLDNAKDAATDPATADLTGRVLEYFGTFTGMKHHHPTAKRAVQWLLSHQEKNGSWYGRWGTCYIYGTWGAVTGLRAVGIEPTQKSMQKAASWLKSIQNDDGGWGESCQSAEMKKYIPLSFSTVSQTAWALDALLTLLPKDDEAIQKGIHFLLKDPHQKEALDYPTGIGLPGQFYIRYHSYEHLYPLLALSHYQRA